MKIVEYFVAPLYDALLTINIYSNKKAEFIFILCF